MIFEQALKFVSQSPENFAYHLIIFLCLQITLGLAYWLRQKSPEDKLASRLLTASAVLLALRIVWAVFLVIWASDRLFLAPVERGLSLVGIAFLMWSLAPAWDEIAHLRIAGLFVVTIGSAIGVYFAYFDWLARFNVQQYADTAQAPAWALAGLFLAGGCLFTLSYFRPFDWILRLAAVVPILAALLFHFFAVDPNQFTAIDLAPELSSGVVPVWDRFAWLLSTPLLVAIAYRRVMAYLLSETGLSGRGRTDLATMLEQSVNLLEADELLGRVEHAAELFDGMYGIQFIGLASISNDDAQFADLAILQKDAAGFDFEEQRRWMLSLVDWPFILKALDEHKAIQLSPYETDSTRQIYELHQELHLRFITPILTVPLARGDKRIGFLLLGARPQQVRWPEDDREVIMRFSDHIARSFLDREKISRLEMAEKGLGLVDDLEITAKIDSLEDENKLLKSRFSQLQNKFKETYRELKNARQAEEERKAAAKPEVDAELKQEVTVLRDALIEAEILLNRPTAPAQAANADSADLDKYAQTITQYSGELELSQQRIEQLEFQLNRLIAGTQDTLFSSPGEEIRSPLSMIQSYTDLLLLDNTGYLSVKQIDLLQRIKNGALKVAMLLDRLDMQFQERLTSLTESDLDVVFTKTLNTLGKSLESRNIKVGLDIDDEFPMIPVGEATLVHVFGSVLGQIANLMPDGGMLNVTVKIDRSGAGEPTSDEAGRFLVFTAQTSAADIPQSADRDQKILAGMTTDGVYSIIKTHAGRIWTDIDSDKGDYQTTILLPIFDATQEETLTFIVSDDAEPQKIIDAEEPVPHGK